MERGFGGSLLTDKIKRRRSLILALHRPLLWIPAVGHPVASWLHLSEAKAHRVEFASGGAIKGVWVRWRMGFPFDAPSPALLASVRGVGISRFVAAQQGRT